MNSHARYLRKIEVDDFRGFLKRFELHVPFDSGVVLLSGMNGLGKTSFFEAVEWALTGKVQRLEKLSDDTDVTKHELINRYSGATSCSVSLGFSDPAEELRLVERQYDCEKGSDLVSGTPLHDVVELLRADPSWRVTEETLHTYLFLTHFHPQASQLRLIARKADERWGRFSQLAGSQQIDRARWNLSRAKRALSDEVQRRTATAALLREKQSSLRDQIMRRQRLASQLDAVAALPPENLRPQLVELGFLPSDPFDAAQALRSAQNQTQERLQAAQSQIDRLRSARDVVARWVAARSRSGRLGERIATLAQDLAQLATDQERLWTREVEARMSVGNLKPTELEARSRLQAVLRGVESRLELTRLTEQEDTLRTELTRAEAALAEAESTATKIAGESDARFGLMKRTAELELEKKGLDAGLTLVGQLELIRKQMDARRIQNLELRARLVRIDATGTQTRAEAEELQRQIERLEADVNAAKGRAKEFESALATIASQLSDTSTSCPVCKVEHAAGTLRDLAMQSVTLMNPELAELEQRLRGDKQRLLSLDAVLRRLRSERRDANAELRSSEKTLFDLEAESQRISASSVVQLDAEFESASRSRLPDLVDALNVATSQLRAMRPHDDINLDIQRAQAGKAELERLCKDLRARLDATRVSRVEHHARLSKMSEHGVDPNGSPEAASVAAQQLTARAEELRSQRELAEKELSEAMEQQARTRSLLEQCNQDSFQATREQQQLVDEMRTLEEQWTRFELPLPPSMVELDRLETDAVMRRDATADTQRRLGYLAISLKTWLSAEELRELDRQIANEVAPASVDAYMRGLEETLKEAEALVLEATSSRSLANDLAEILREESENFNVGVLGPLENLFQAYIRVLVHDERLHALRMQTETKARDGRLRVRLPSGHDAGARDDVGPEAELVLSEGQIAEVSVAALLAASCAYRWSSWRALLLDDPTQYNDLIRSTALFEVVRNLVHFEGYQVFISTHDVQQAEFFRRKLEGMRVPCLECRYLSLDGSEIQYEVIEGMHVQ